MPHNGWNDFLVRIIDGTPIGLDAGLPIICELLADCGGLFATCRQGA